MGASGPASLELRATSRGELHLLTVVPVIEMSAVASYFPVDYEAKMVARARLSKLVAESVPSEVSVTEHVALGSIYDAILRTEEKIDADLIVVASARAEGLPDWTQRRARGAAFETLRLRRARVDVSQVYVDALYQRWLRRCIRRTTGAPGGGH